MGDRGCGLEPSLTIRKIEGIGGQRWSALASEPLASDASECVFTWLLLAYFFWPHIKARRLGLIRVFPRKTKATPDDELAYFGPPDLFAEADEVHVSVTFTYDKPIAEHLAEQWRHVAPVKIGGVAYGDASLEFMPGRYVKPGYTITSRGCPRRCWFCWVWKRIRRRGCCRSIDGWNILDDNLLACPRDARRGGVRHAAPAKSAHRIYRRARSTRAGRLSGRSAGEPDAAAEHVLCLRSRRRVRDAGACRPPPARGRLHRALASDARLCPDRLSRRTRSHRPSSGCARCWRSASRRWRCCGGRKRHRRKSIRPSAWRGFQRRWARPAIIHAAAA